jgi:hypothetical protein
VSLPGVCAHTWLIFGECGKRVEDGLRVGHIDGLVPGVYVGEVIVELLRTILLQVRVQTSSAQDALYIALKCASVLRLRHQTVCLNMLGRHDSITLADERFDHGHYKLSRIALKIPVLFPQIKQPHLSADNSYTRAFPPCCFNVGYCWTNQYARPNH